MAINAYGTDFWIGRVFRSKDSRELWRHVVIADMRNGRARCHNLLVGEPKKVNSRGTWISFKTLATRWENCPADKCFCKNTAEIQSQRDAEVA
jgi:hypothetical protein